MNQMMELAQSFDGKGLPIKHIPGPEGVRGRNSNNELILEKLGWAPSIKLADGLKARVPRKPRKPRVARCAAARRHWRHWRGARRGGRAGGRR